MVLAIFAVSAVYLWRPSFVSNFVSVFPAMIVHLPLNLSLQNQNFENVTRLLEKQRVYGQYLGETEVMAANLAANTQRTLESVILKSDSDIEEFTRRIQATKGIKNARFIASMQDVDY